MTYKNLQEFWDSHFPFPLSEQQADLWLAIHTEATLKKGLDVTFSKWERDKAKMDEGYLIRYASKTLNNIKARAAMAQEVSLANTQ